MYKKILVPLDGSELVECVLPHVESIVGGSGVQNGIFFRIVEPIRPLNGDEGSSLSTERWRSIQRDEASFQC